ncbi:MAG: mechanosensitive ion channel [Woeseiaceae bacterium]|nr:mechanosensitive ion channel [Woeseiaceae bacterium]
MDRLTVLAREYGQLVVDFVTRPEIWIQLVIIAGIVVPAVLLARRVEPRLEERARQIRRMPGLLRIIIAFLRRFEWIFFVLFLAVAYIATGTTGWPGSNYLIYAAMLLSGAWLLISVVSHAVRSRILRRTFAIVAWIYVAAKILGITDDVAIFLDSAGFNVGDMRFSLLTLLKTGLLLGLALWVSFAFGNFLDRRIQTVDELTPSLRVLLGKIIRIGLVAFAGIIVVSGLGIDLTALTVLSGAVGVGIGFGLQKVVSNFISGIIILLDQSIKPGDTITLGETFGWIRELRARFVSVITRDGREYLIPNEDFITREVINWSFSDKFVRLDVDFGVSYSADPHEVIRRAGEAAAGVDRVQTDAKQPVCWMTEFGDSSINFKLRFWIDDPQQGLTNIRGQVLIALWDTFKEHGIGIPFPHREVLFRTPLNIVTDQPGT